MRTILATLFAASVMVASNAGAIPSIAASPISSERVANKPIVITKQGSSGTTVAASSDGSVVAYSQRRNQRGDKYNSASVYLHIVKTGKSRLITKSAASEAAIAMSDNGRYVAFVRTKAKRRAGGGESLTYFVNVWDRRSGQVENLGKGLEGVAGTFSSTGNWFAFLDNGGKYAGSFRLVDLRTGVSREIGVGIDVMNCYDFGGAPILTADGSELFFLDSDCDIAVWDASSGDVEKTVKLDYGPIGFDISRDGRYVAYRGVFKRHDMPAVFDRTEGDTKWIKKFPSNDDQYRSVELSGNGRYLFVEVERDFRRPFDNGYAMMRYRVGKPSSQLVVEERGFHYMNLSTSASNLDGDRFAWATNKGSVKMWKG